MSSSYERAAGGADAATGCSDAAEPGPRGRGHRPEVGPQAVVAGHQRHGPARGRRRNAERVALALHDQHRDPHPLELGEAARRRRVADRRGGG